MKNNDGGPAFPVNYISMDSCGNERVQAQDFGMSLRDYFAAKAMQGMLSHSTRYKPRIGCSDNWHEAITQESYEIADAMLSAREE